MKLSIHILLFFCFSGLVKAQETSLKFPEKYFGNYKGDLLINNNKGQQTLPMEFHLFATDTIGKYGYSIIYGEGEQKQERKYFLIDKNKEKGEFIVDEDNGILLHEQLFGNTLYSIFEVSGNLLTTFITFETDHLIWEVTFSSKENKQLSKATEDNTEVIAYPISTRQRAILKKQ